MTREEAAAEQERIAKDYDLSYWYGTDCEKCCGVYPRFHQSMANGIGCFYQCDVCGKRTEPQPMPWVARDEWNAGNYAEEQISFF